MSEAEGKQKTFTITEGLILATVPAMAYLLAFNYERGYTAYFRIPREFISVELTSIFILATIGVGLAAYLFLFVLNPLHMVYLALQSKRVNPYLLHNLIQFGALVLLFGIILYLVGWSFTPLWIFALFIVASFGAIYFLLPLITHRDKRGYLAKLEAQHELDKNVPGLLSGPMSKLGLKALLIPAIIVAFSLSYFAGYGEARKQERYLVITTSPEMVVLRIYGDTLIAAPFDRNTGEVESSFTVINLANNSTLSLKLEEIGPLNPMELPSASSTPPP